MRKINNDYYWHDPQYKKDIGPKPSKSRVPENGCEGQEYFWYCKRYCHDPDLSDAIAVRRPAHSCCAFSCVVSLKQFNFWAWLYFGNISS